MSKITSLGLPSGGSPVVTITGNVGGAVTPDGAGNFNLLGTDFLTSTGNPGTNTLTFDIIDNVKTTAVYSQEKAFTEALLGSVASDGSTVSLTLTTESGLDTSVLFSDGFHDLSIGTVPVTVTLTPGTDSTPMINYVYYDQATITLTVATTGWPAASHAKVSEILVPSAARVQTKGVYSAHNYHTDVEGHIIHMSDWIREQNATYVSGISQNLVITTNAGSADNVIFTSTAGEVLQLHEHDFPAFTGTPDIYVVNGASAYTIVTDLNSCLTDSSGSSLSGKYFSLVIWGVISPNGAGSKLMLNLPSGGYTSANYLLKDVRKKTNYSIPTSFKGTGFLIARLDLHHTTADSGTWALEKLVDLRGLFPSLVAGGGAAQTSEFLDTEFKILDDTDITSELMFEVSPVSTGTTRTIIMGDRDIDMDALPDSFISDAGTATPVGGVLNVAGGTNIATAGAGTTLTVNFDGTLPVSSGGTGATSLNDHGVLLGQGTSAVSTKVLTDGQVLIGSTGVDPVASTLTAGSGVSITNAAGSITIANTGVVSTEFADNTFRITDNGDATKKIAFEASSITTATVRTITMDDRNINMSNLPDTFVTDSGSVTPLLGSITVAGGSNIATAASGTTLTINYNGSTPLAWISVAGTSASMSSNHGYITQNSALTTFTLPGSPSIGDLIRVVGYGTGGWKVDMNGTSSQIQFGSTLSTASTGSVSSTAKTDAMELVCVASGASLVWDVISSMGNITVV